MPTTSWRWSRRHRACLDVPRVLKLAHGIDELPSFVVGCGMVSPMSCFFEVQEVERVTVLRDQSTGVRTGGMRECRDRLRRASLH